jgi:hypothetical protein
MTRPAADLTNFQMANVGWFGCGVSRIIILKCRARPAQLVGFGNEPKWRFKRTESLMLGANIGGSRRGLFAGDGERSDALTPNKPNHEPDPRAVQRSGLISCCPGIGVRRPLRPNLVDPLCLRAGVPRGLHRMRTCSSRTHGMFSASRRDEKLLMNLAAAAARLVAMSKRRAPRLISKEQYRQLARCPRQTERQ